MGFISNVDKLCGGRNPYCDWNMANDSEEKKAGLTNEH